MPPVFLYRYGPLLLVLHALLAFGLLGSSVHQAVIAVLCLRRRVRPRLLRVYGVVAASTYVATLLSGGLLYPRYRYFVRVLYLDRHAAWAANLFDLKENLATLGLPLSIGALVLAFDLPRHQKDEAAGGDRQALIVYLYGLLSLGAAAIVLFNVVSGLLCTGVRGV